MEEPIVVPVARELYLPIVRARAILEEARKTVTEAEKNLGLQQAALFSTLAPGKVKDYNEKNRYGTSSSRYVSELTEDGRFMVFRIAYDR
jgi:hypothetical protein